MTPNKAKALTKYLIEEKKERAKYFKENKTMMGYKKKPKKKTKLELVLERDEMARTIIVRRLIMTMLFLVFIFILAI